MEIPIEDWIMGVSSLIFLFGLSAQIRKIIKTKDTSAISYLLAGGNTTALILYVFCMASLNLWLSAITLLIQGSLWGTVLWLKYYYEKVMKINPKDLNSDS